MSDAISRHGVRRLAAVALVVFAAVLILAGLASRWATQKSLKEAQERRANLTELLRKAPVVEQSFKQVALEALDLQRYRTTLLQDLTEVDAWFDPGRINTERVESLQGDYEAIRWEYGNTGPTAESLADQFAKISGRRDALADALDIEVGDD